jgi:hypothetical protein
MTRDWNASSVDWPNVTSDPPSADAPATDAPPRCEGRLYERGANFQCSRRGYARGDDGKAYCKMHDPRAIAERRQARDRKWKAEMEARDAAIAAAEEKARELGIGDAGSDGSLTLTADEARVLTTYLVEGEASVRDGWRFMLLRAKLPRRPHAGTDA